MRQPLVANTGSRQAMPLYERRLIFVLLITLPFLNLFRAAAMMDSIVLISDVLLLAALLAFWGRTAIQRKSLRIPHPFVFQLTVLWIVITLLGIVVGVSEPKHPALFTIVRLARLYALSLLFFFTSRWFRRADIILLAKALVIIGMVTSLYGVYQEIFGFTPFERAYLASPAVGGFTRNPDLFNRMFSTFGAPGIFATYGLFSFWLSVGLWGEFGAARYGRALLVVAMLLAVAALVVSRMRLALASLVISLLFYLLLRIRHFKAVVSSTAALLLLSVILVVLANSTGFVTFLNLEDLMASFEVRVSVLENVLPSLSVTRPLGRGIGASIVEPIPLDNSYLNLTLELGWFGLAAFSLLALSVFLSGLIRTRSIGDATWRGLCTGIWLGILCIAMMGNGSSVFFNSIMSPYFWFFAGVLGNSALMEKQQC